MESNDFSPVEVIALALDELLSSRSSDFTVRGVPWSRPKGTPRITGLPLNSEELCSYFLVAVSDLLCLPPAGMPLRQCLATLLAGAPVDPAASELLRAAQMNLRQFKWSRLLDLDCEAVKELLGFLGERLYEEREDRKAWQESRDRERAAREKSSGEQVVRTPAPFRYGRQSYPFPYRQSLILECLRCMKEIAVTEALVHVWGGTGLSGSNIENRLHKLQSDTNSNLLKFNLPLTITRPGPGILLLKRLSARGKRG